MRTAIFTGLSVALLMGQSVAWAKESDTSASVPEKCPKLQASTVFVPDKATSRQQGSAKKLSEAHKKAETQGWNFDEMQIYIEDGDLQGFFVTYTREYPCNSRE